MATAEWFENRGCGAAGDVGGSCERGDGREVPWRAACRRAAARARARTGVALADRMSGSVDAMVGRNTNAGLARPVASIASGSGGWTTGRLDGTCWTLADTYVEGRP